MSGRRPARRRGFTLLEAVVALAAGGVILAAATSVVTVQVKLNARARAERDLSREGDFAARLLELTLSQAGVGVPTLDPIVSTASLTLTPVIVSGATQVGILADLARPHSGLPTIGTLHSRPGGDRRHISWHTENNGACVPGPCSIADTSMFFPGEPNSLCDAAGDFYDRVCPWGLRRLDLGDYIVISSGSGAWTQGRAPTAAAGALESFTPIAAQAVWFLKLAADYDDNVIPDWPNATTADEPISIAGNNFVSTPDRLFYVYDAPARALRRAQCWGRIDSAAAWWPPLGATAMPGTFDNAPTNVCTPFELVLANVDSVAFSYYDSAGAITANQAAMRRIDFVIRTSKNAFGTTLRYVIYGSAPIRWNG